MHTAKLIWIYLEPAKCKFGFKRTKRRVLIRRSLSPGVVCSQRTSYHTSRYHGFMEPLGKRIVFPKWLISRPITVKTLQDPA